MIVVSLTNCPPKLRGDLTKWLIEINAGVYVGRVSARVRDELWQRICENVKEGRATMVFSANNEQGMDFYVHNTTWKPVEFDGITLMLRPDEAAEQGDDNIPLSRAAQFQKIRNIRTAAQKKAQRQDYYVVDVETTGLRADQNDIIELAALHVEDHQPMETFSVLIQMSVKLPAAITELTGITDEMLKSDGIALGDAMQKFLNFVSNCRVVCHNAGFDYAFLKAACRKCHLPEFKNQYADTLQIAKRKLPSAPDHKLSTLARLLECEVSGEHRALDDCRTTYQVYEKLNEID